MNRDYNLLFGVLAVQLHKVTPTKLMEAASAWAVDPRDSLSGRLVSLGALSEADRSLIDRLVTEAVRAHDGDSSAALASFGGEAEAYQSLGGSIVLTADGGVSIAPDFDRATLASVGAADPSQIRGVFENPGRYTRQSEHGRGGMGRVLLVHDEYLGRDIALKELLPHLGDTTMSTQSRFPGMNTPGSTESGTTPVRFSAHILSRFLQEARITGQLEHPSIVPVYELGHRKDGTLYYTMKLVRGRSFAKAIQDAGSLGGRLVLISHFVDLCQAIAYAHSRNVIHRDIKPANVMVGEFGETVVLDWGLAKSRNQEDIHERDLAATLSAMNLGDEAAVAQTAYGQALGTPVYMPPEQARGELDDINERSDVYALGAVLYEILTGQAPFKGGSVAVVFQQVLHESPRPVQDIVPDAPPELIAIARKAMEKNQENRYESAKDLAEDVQRFLSGALVRAHDYGYSEYVKRWARRNRAILATGAVALLLLVAAGGAFLARLAQQNQELVQARDEESKQRKAAEDARQRAEANELQAQDALKEAEFQSYVSSIRLADNYINSGQPALAVDLLWRTPPGQRHWEWSYLLASAYLGDAANVAGDDSVLSLDQNQDGTQILTSHGRNNAIITEKGSSRLLRSFEGHSLGLTRALFSPDGKRVLTGSWDKTARIWDTASGEQTLLLGGHTEAVVDVDWSPSSDRVATASWDTTVKVWDSETGSEIFTFKHPFVSTYAEFALAKNWLLTGCADDRTRVWDLDTGLLLYEMPGGQWGAVANNGETVIAMGEDAVTQLRIGPPETMLTGPLDTFLFKGERIWIKPEPGGDEIRVLTIQEGESAAEFTYGSIRLAPAGNSLGVESVTLDARMNFEEALAACAGTYRVSAMRPAVRLWREDISDSVLVERPDLQGFPRLTDSGSIMNFLQIDGRSTIFDTENWDKLYSSSDVWLLGENSLAISRKDRTSYILYESNTLLCFRYETGEISWVLRGVPTGNLTLDPESGNPVIWDSNGKETVYSRVDGVMQSRHDTHTLAPGADSESTPVLSRYGDKILLLSMGSGESVRFQGHSNPISAHVMSGDGRRMFSASASELKVWDVDSGTELLDFSNSKTGFRPLLYDDTRHRLYAQGSGGLLYWDLPDWHISNERESSTTDAKDRFRDHLQESTSDPAKPSAQDSSTNWHFTSTFVLEFALPRFRQLLEVMGTAKFNSLLVSRGESRELFKYGWLDTFGFLNGDRIIAFNGVSFEGPDLLQHLDRLADSLDSIGRFSVDIERNDGAYITQQYLLLPVETERDTVVSSRVEFAAAVKLILGLTSTLTTEELGEPINEVYGLPGILLSTEVDDGVPLPALGLGGMNALLTHINGTEVSTAQTLVDVLSTLGGTIERMEYRGLKNGITSFERTVNFE